MVLRSGPCEKHGQPRTSVGICHTGTPTSPGADLRESWGSESNRDRKWPRRYESHQWRSWDCLHIRNRKRQILMRADLERSQIRREYSKRCGGAVKTWLRRQYEQSYSVLCTVVMGCWICRRHSMCIQGIPDWRNNQGLASSSSRFMSTRIVSQRGPLV